MQSPDTEIDPSGVIREAYRIDAITGADCRTIFLDWALTRGGDLEYRHAVQSLLQRHAGEPEDHPMTQTLKAALDQPPAKRRRGGARARR
ncbi:MAG: hypothetical protein AAF334_06035 [Pseudomonadota bacterium]